MTEKNILPAEVKVFFPGMQDTPGQHNDVVRIAAIVFRIGWASGL